MRVHIERVIGLLKNRYRILDGVLSTTFIKSLSDEANEAKVTGIDKLVTVCSALCNLGDGIVYKDKKILYRQHLVKFSTYRQQGKWCTVTGINLVHILFSF